VEYDGIFVYPALASDIAVCVKMIVISITRVGISCGDDHSALRPQGQCAIHKRRELPTAALLCSVTTLLRDCLAEVLAVTMVLAQHRHRTEDCGCPYKRMNGLAVLPDRFTAEHRREQGRPDWLWKTDGGKHGIRPREVPCPRSGAAIVTTA